MRRRLARHKDWQPLAQPDLKLWIDSHVKDKNHLGLLCQRWGLRDSGQLIAFLRGYKRAEVFPEMLLAMSRDTGIKMETLVIQTGLARMLKNPVELNVPDPQPVPVQLSLVSDVKQLYQESDFSPDKIWVRARQVYMVTCGKPQFIELGMRVLGPVPPKIDFTPLSTGHDDMVQFMVTSDHRLVLRFVSFDYPAIEVIKMGQRMGYIQVAGPAPMSVSVV